MYRLICMAMTLWMGTAQAASVANAELQAKLLQLGAEDQAIRATIPPVGSPEYKAFAEKLTAIDSRNTAELERIVERFGWPGVDLVGTDASNAAFLILQHASLARQRTLLPVFRQAVTEGRARSADLALLEDRILVGEGKKQRYGSQVTAGPDGIPRLAPIEDPENVDSRRKELGLPPLEDYLKDLESRIGKTIERQ